MKLDTKEILATFMDNLTDTVLRKTGDYYKRWFECIPLYVREHRELYIVFHTRHHGMNFVLRIVAKPESVVGEDGKLIREVKFLVLGGEHDTVMSIRGVVSNGNFFVYVIDNYGVETEIYYDDVYVAWEKMGKLVEELGDRIVASFDVVKMFAEKLVYSNIVDMYEELHDVVISEEFVKLRFEYDENAKKLYGELILDIPALVLSSECGSKCVKNALKLHEKHGNLIDIGRVDFGNLRVRKSGDKDNPTKMYIVMEGLVKSMFGYDRLVAWKGTLVRWYWLLGSPEYRKSIRVWLAMTVREIIQQWLRNYKHTVVENLENMQIN